MRYAILAVLATILLSAQTCRSNLTAIDEMVQFTASIDDSDFGQGEQATLKFEVVNISNRAVEIRFSSGCQILPYIERGSEQVHPRGPWLCTAALTTLRLEPGERKEQLLPIQGGSEYSHGLILTLPPGEYTAYAELGQRPGVKAETNRLTFRVR